MTAEIVHNKVVRVIEGSSVWATETLGGTWIDTNVNIGIGYDYNADTNTFTPPKPFPSWVWNGSAWVAPVNKPDSMLKWNEINQSWE